MESNYSFYGTVAKDQTEEQLAPDAEDEDDFKSPDEEYY